MQVGAGGCRRLQVGAEVVVAVACSLGIWVMHPATAKLLPWARVLLASCVLTCVVLWLLGWNTAGVGLALFCGPAGRPSPASLLGSSFLAWPPLHSRAPLACLPPPPLPCCPAVAALVSLSPDEVLLPCQPGKSSFSALVSGMTVHDQGGARAIAAAGTGPAMHIALHRVPKPRQAANTTSSPHYAVVYHRDEGVVENRNQGAAPFTLLPLGTVLANGGKAAERTLLARLLQALAPMRKPGMPAVGASTDLMRSPHRAWGQCAAQHFAACGPNMCGASILLPAVTRCSSAVVQVQFSST